ncbi:histidine phosphatase family protein [Macrococcus equipercicus]|uniref:Histidine phosphatase family protein n=1 Tax=Macrococcus equipercicus TaxID=69967 RepID=A0A9Q9F1C1_9STAP|nr:histidine phosphatase family protein [Macrococcus equipercicus]UTH13873.1 histidine phosphatase family protein [Macrococcus equipercicus]
MSIVYFVRHAERDITIQEDETAPLTINGKKDANELKHFFADKNIKAIYSSPYQRTVHTIEPTASFLNLDINLINDLHERKIGSWIDDFSFFSEQQWKDFDYKRLNGESLNEVAERLLVAYREITNNIEGDIIICGHGTAFAVLFHHLTEGEFGFDEWQRMKMPDIYRYKIENKKLKKIKYV